MGVKHSYSPTIIWIILVLGLGIKFIKITWGIIYFSLIVEVGWIRNQTYYFCPCLDSHFHKESLYKWCKGLKLFLVSVYWLYLYSLCFWISTVLLFLHQHSFDADPHTLTVSFSLLSNINDILSFSLNVILSNILFIFS